MLDVTEMININTESNLNKSIRIESIKLNSNTYLVEVDIVGINGETYYIKVAEKETMNNFKTQEVSYYDNSNLTLQLSLKKDKVYEFSLFDIHNVVLDVFTFKSPVDFKYIEPISETITETKNSEPIVLAQTSHFDSYIFYFCIIIVIFLTFVQRFKWLQKIYNKYRK